MSSESEKSFHGALGAAQIAYDEEEYDTVKDALNPAIAQVEEEERGGE